MSTIWHDDDRWMSEHAEWVYVPTESKRGLNQERFWSLLLALGFLVGCWVGIWELAKYVAALWGWK